MFVMFYFCYKTKKNVYYTSFSVHSLVQYIVFNMDMTIALKALNEMQQTASMRLTLYHMIYHLYTLLSNVLLFNTVI